jgi:hypothetical protein
VRRQFSRQLQSRGYDKEIIAAFRKARDKEFAAVAAEFDGFAGAIREQSRGKHLSAGRLSTHESEMDRLHSELERIAGNDFFTATGRAAAFAAYERCQKELRAAQGPKANTSSSDTKRGKLEVAKYQGQGWVTRRNLHIDRLVSASLIKQFIDKRPRFYFVAEGETIEGATPFDMLGLSSLITGKTARSKQCSSGLDSVKTKACARSQRSFTTSI